MWALQCDRVHVYRLSCLLEHISIDFQPANVIYYCINEETSFLLCKYNPILSLPCECLRFISRLFYVPYSCLDPESLITHSSLLQPLLDRNNDHNFDECHNTVLLRVSAAPKEVEDRLLDAILPLIRGYDLHPTKYSYILCCIYLSSEAVFRWGVVTAAYASEQMLTSEALDMRLTLYRSIHYTTNKEPVSRAYHKLHEVLHVYLTSWGWKLCDNISNTISIDLGASPGGWTQCLSTICKQVLAIDSGALHERVLSLSNVIHIPYNIQSKEVADVLQAYKANKESINLIVCDINCDPVIAADLLVQHILPYTHTGRPDLTAPSLTHEPDLTAPSLTHEPDLTAPSPTHEPDLTAPSPTNEPNLTAPSPTNEPDLTAPSPTSDVIIVLTLKLLKGPKSRHVISAVNGVFSRLQAYLTSLEPLHTHTSSSSGIHSLRTCGHISDWKPLIATAGKGQNYDLDDVCVGLGRDAYLVHLCSNSSNERTLVMRMRLG